MAQETDTVAFTAEIVGAYSGHNRLSPSEIGPLIAVVHKPLPALAHLLRSRRKPRRQRFPFAAPCPPTS